MTTSIAINPTGPHGVEIKFSSLPYEVSRVTSDCGHSFLYVMRNYENQPLFCGLCFFRGGYEAELPTRIHVTINPRFSTLAENGNIEMAPKFFSHLFLAMGLKPPKKDENLRHFRASRARGQYTKAAPSLFPVATALWKLMGYQPPLGTILIAGVTGQTEQEIAKHLDLSIFGVYQRMMKAIHLAMHFLPKERISNG